MYPVVLMQRCRPPAGKFRQFLRISARASFSCFKQLSNVAMLPGPNMLVMAFSDVRQVVAISTVGTLADAALATPGPATIRQNRLVARSFPFVVHDTAGFSSATSTVGFIVLLLVYGDLLAWCTEVRDACWNGIASDPTWTCGERACERHGSRRTWLGPLNLRTISSAQSTMVNVVRRRNVETRRGFLNDGSNPELARPHLQMHEGNQVCLVPLT